MTKFTDEDNKEAMLKAFELFGLCMESGPCNNCVFFDRSLPENPCSIGCPNSWSLFDTSTENGTKNRKVIFKLINKRRKRSE